jgi:glycosyltransferase involved in cell wall biosynthesis
MKVLHLSYSDINGGAARATYRIHHALRKEGIDSRMWVNKLSSEDWTVEGPLNKIDKFFIELRPRIINNLLTKTLKTENLIIHSPSVLSSKLVKRINSSDADIVHLHWIQGEMLSISDIAKIKKPIVWSPQDMWVFSGAEHYTNDYRWRDGYRSDNRPSYESGFDLNRWTWKRKKKYWQRPIQIIASSQWLATCVNESLLMSNWPVSVVPNTINTDYWKPLDKKFARNQLDLPVSSPLVLFGAIGGAKDPRKGYDLMINSLKLLQNNPSTKGLELVIFGQHRPQSPPSLGFPVHYMGHLYDDLSLRALYSSVDAMLIPSRQDNLPNTGLEAHACATPVIAFNTGGLADIVEHKFTGYLAKAFDIEDFANGIIWTLEQSAIGQLGNQARERVVLKFSERVIATAYIEIYNKVLNII